MKAKFFLLALSLAAVLAACNQEEAKAEPKPVPELVAPQDAGTQVLKMIMERRSVRKYLDKPVEHEKLEKIVECGLNAPNGMNKQLWAVRVVEDRNFVTEVTEIFKKEQPETVANDPSFKTMFRNAYTVIAVATRGGEAKNDGDLISAGMLGENMILAAQALGLGTCTLGGPVNFLKTSEAAKPYLDRLALPEGYDLTYMIAVGYPDETPEYPGRDLSKVEYLR